MIQFAWLPCSLILRQEQGSEKEIAEVNTRKALWYARAEVNTLKRPCVRLLPDNWDLERALRGIAITLFYGPISCIC